MVNLKFSLFLAVLACTFMPEQTVAGTIKTLRVAPRENEPLEWWQETIIYQIYPRSHKDSDGDGIGDLVGIQSSLDYLVDLGVNAVWISPIYKSPMKDFGYDISDFKDIEPLFGNIAQFEEMAAAMRERGIKLIMDFVPNHSSDKHEWFQKSVAREPEFEDYYVWRNASGFNGGEPLPPNNWVSVFGGPAWTWNADRGQFYLHQFIAAQPDLNFENPIILQELLDAMKFWLDKGVDGFRMDAVPMMFENQSFEDEPENPDRDPDTTPEEYSYWLHPYTYNLPPVFDALAQFRKLLDIYSLKDGKQRVMMVEAGVPTLDQLFEYYGTKEKPIAHFPFNFELIKRIKAPVTGTAILNLLNNWFDNLPEGAWSNWLVGNHDQKRVSKRFGNENIDILNMIVLLLPGNAVTYYGEEIGMEDTFLTWEETIDPAGCQAGIEKYEQYSRDPCRTPMQWNASANAGFSTGGSTWLPLNPNYETVNVAAQLAEPESHINVYKQISLLRKTDAWKYGELRAATANIGQVFGFTRRLEDGTGFLVLVNFAELLVTVNAAQTFGVPPEATVVTRNVGFVPTTTVIGSVVTTANIVVGAKSSLIVSF